MANANRHRHRQFRFCFLPLPLRSPSSIPMVVPNRPFQAEQAAGNCDLTGQQGFIVRRHHAPPLCRRDHPLAAQVLQTSSTAHISTSETGVTAPKAGNQLLVLLASTTPIPQTRAFGSHGTFDYITPINICISAWTTGPNPQDAMLALVLLSCSRWPVAAADAERVMPVIDLQFSTPAGHTDLLIAGCAPLECRRV